MVYVTCPETGSHCYLHPHRINHTAHCSLDRGSSICHHGQLTAPCYDQAWLCLPADLQLYNLHQTTALAMNFKRKLSLNTRDLLHCKEDENLFQKSLRIRTNFKLVQLFMRFIFYFHIQFHILRDQVVGSVFVLAFFYLVGWLHLLHPNRSI